ncbi:streptomycin 6-kinase [Aliiruegeria haliotis]|uniref:Streptomycin 6-kinase n=1 Tax=Aliiruegeria haliotis TaxID=1280846 RepID=A0A2T0RWH4_9RHOB|nr:aminoglycoside phosphotransferase family protein [Aliiruegeria haliotis]PRY25497.1 streptomycin 6-kinase [Aliiruegeria haliotis]
MTRGGRIGHAAEVLLRRHQCVVEARVAVTGLATVWKVRGPSGPAALKLYHGGDMRNESHGFDLLAALDGRGVARLLDREPGLALLEWLEGPSLGDLVRDGQDDVASEHLLDVARQLHSGPMDLPEPLPTLEAWFSALFALRMTSDCPSELRGDIGRAQAIARGLLASPRDVTPLHGDLHHDNIRMGARGWLAFDAKGVIGDRGYELANAFRNPVGADDLIRQPDRIRRLADLWSVGFGVDRGRLLKWAAAKAALSMAWSSGGHLGKHEEADILSILLEISEADVPLTRS